MKNLNRTTGIPLQLYSKNIIRYKALHISSMFHWRNANQKDFFFFFFHKYQEKQTIHNMEIPFIE